MRRHPEVPFWISVGDLADDDGPTSRSRRRSTGSRGTTRTSTSSNRDGFPEPSSHHKPAWRDSRNRDRRAGRHAGAYGVRDARRRTAASSKIGRAATELADKRRHFVREEVEACKRFRRRCVHDARSGSPYRVEGRRPRHDAGRRRSTKCWQPCAAPAPVRASPSVTQQDASGRPFGRARPGLVVVSAHRHDDVGLLERADAVELDAHAL